MHDSQEQGPGPGGGGGEPFNWNVLCDTALGCWYWENVNNNNNNMSSCEPRPPGTLCLVTNRVISHHNHPSSCERISIDIPPVMSSGREPQKVIGDSKTVVNF